MRARKLLTMSENHPHEHVAEWLRMQLGGKRINYSEAARRLGYTQQTFSRKVNGLTPFTIDEMFHIAKVFGLDLGEWVDAARSMGD